MMDGQMEDVNSVLILINLDNLKREFLMTPPSWIVPLIISNYQGGQEGVRSRYLIWVQSLLLRNDLKSQHFSFYKNLIQTYYNSIQEIPNPYFYSL